MSHYLQIINLLVRGIGGLAGVAVRRQQTNSQNAKQEIEFVSTALVQSLVAFQQGLEIFTQHLSTLDDSTIMDRGKEELKNLFRDIIEASSMAGYFQIPNVCLSLRNLIPCLTLLKDKIDPRNSDIIRANEAFQCSSLCASAVFQSTNIKKQVSHVLFYSLATAMRMNAAIMQHFTCPELLSMVVIGHLGQLEHCSHIYKRLFGKKKSTEKICTLKVLECLLNLGANLLPLFRPEDREQFLKDFQSFGLLMFVSRRLVVGQTSFGSQGINDGDLDRPCGIVVNSKGNVIIADSRNGKIKALASDGSYLWHCEVTQSESLDNNIPIAIATDQQDHIFAIYYREDTKECTIVKYDPNGAILRCFNTQRCFGDQDHDVIPCGMSVNSRGLIYLGDAGNRCIHVLDGAGTSLLTRVRVFQIKALKRSQFSFCIGLDGKIVVATNKRVCVYHENGTFCKKFLLKNKAGKVSKEKPLAMAYDIDHSSIVIVTCGQGGVSSSCYSSKTVRVKPMLWFLSQSYDLVDSVECPLADIDNTTDGRFSIAAGRNGIWCANEATHRIHHFTMMNHVIEDTRIAC